MPHTLAHIGAQALGTRALLPRADGVWILAACAVPDLPWLIQRALQLPGVGDPYALRFYAVAQASLLSCLVLCGALAALARAPGRAFAALALGSLLHLLLDATQWKFGNGVHLFAPVSWELLHFDWYTPEGWPTLLLTGLGAGAFLWLWREPPASPFRVSPGRLAVAGGLLLAWLLLPLALLAGPESSDAHSTTTLRDRGERPGRSVDFDRNRYVRGPRGHVLHTFAGESITLVDAPLGDAGLVSVHGRFLDETTVAVLRAREHPPGLRDAASGVGLLAIAAFWVRAILAGRSRDRSPPGA
ncbi:MAG: hypothetical protein ACQGVC_00185 [Myxococcota bacterium]